MSVVAQTPCEPVGNNLIGKVRLVYAELNEGVLHWMNPTDCRSPMDYRSKLHLLNPDRAELPLRTPCESKFQSVVSQKNTTSTGVELIFFTKSNPLPIVYVQFHKI